MKYFVCIAENLDALTKAVNENIARGARAQGGIAVTMYEIPDNRSDTGGRYYEFYQAMILETAENKDLDA